MRGLLRDYVIILYNDVPVEIYEGLLSLFCLGAVILFAIKGIKHGLRSVAGLLLVEYVFLIYCSTVFFRPVSEGKKYDFHPFWSYVAIRDGGSELIAENIMNVLVFVPMGFLLGMVFRKISLWKIIIVGFCMSMSIEALQFFFHRGVSEVDDVMHNTLGCMIGYGLYYLIRNGYEKLIKERIAVL